MSEDKETIDITKLNIYQKMTIAIDRIKANRLTKDGKNTFSKYDYFTPSIVESLVYDSINGLGLFIKFDLIRNSLGIDGILTIIDVNSNDTIVYTLASSIPVIKATNSMQQLGGSQTYSERYLLMNAFRIKDNTLDFDSNEAAEKLEKDKKAEIKRLANEEKKRLEAIAKQLTPDEAVLLVDKCTTLKELTDIWNKHHYLREDNDFHSSVKDKTEEIKNSKN